MNNTNQMYLDAELLHTAVREENIEHVRLLVHAGVKSSIRGATKQSPLHTAVSRGSIELVQALLSGLNAQDFIQTDCDGWTIFHAAAFHCRIDVLELLLESSKEMSCDLPIQPVNDDTIVTSNLTGRTPLHLAVAEGWEDGVALLLAYGADPNAADIHGKTPLHLAVFYGRIEIVRRISSLTTCLRNQANAEGQTPLQVARYREKRTYGKEAKIFSQIQVLLMSTGAENNSSYATHQSGLPISLNTTMTQYGSFGRLTLSRTSSIRTNEH